MLSIQRHFWIRVWFFGVICLSIINMSCICVGVNEICFATLKNINDEIDFYNNSNDINELLLLLHGWKSYYAKFMHVCKHASLKKYQFSPTILSLNNLISSFHIHTNITPAQILKWYINWLKTFISKLCFKRQQHLYIIICET